MSTDLPNPAEPAPDGPRIGVDEWVARHGERSGLRGGPLGPLIARAEKLPWWLLLAVAVALSSLVPLVSSSDYVIRVAVNTVLFALLAVGLNVVVGWAGLLDLGFVAFYGFGAYMYALLSSEQFGVHLPAELAIPLVVVSSALLGLLLGLPSRRLLGDYLAIVTLFFAQIFVVLATNADAIRLPWNTGPTDFTGGPNGVTDIDPISLLGFEFGSTRSYLWLSLGVFTVVVVALYLVNHSRTGRAWRAVREDPLAAELMSMPVNRLKLLAFMFGAATAGLTGTIFASLQLGVFPGNFDLPLLITIYAMVILGGVGSIPGVVIGAITINVSLELLRDPGNSRALFYTAIGLGLLLLLRPWAKLALVAAGTIVFGIVVFQLVDAIRPAWTSGSIEGGRFSDLLDGWIVHPANWTRLGNAGFVLLIVAVLALTELRGIWRTLLLPPTLYLAAFVWENRLVEQQQARLRGGRARDLEPAPVRVRERVRRLVPPVAHQPPAEERELLLRERGDLPLLAPHPRRAQDRADDAGLRPAERRRHHVLLHGHVQEQPQRLERARDAALRDHVRRQSEQRGPVEEDLAAVGAVDAGDQVEERRLAGAVRADHADDLALVDVQVEPVDHLQAAEGLRDPLQLEDAEAAAQTISTLEVPSSPCGRQLISTIRSAPRSRIRVTLGSVTRRFSQTNAAR